MTSSPTSSATSPWASEPPASVPTNTGIPASYAARTVSYRRAWSLRMWSAQRGNLPSPPAARCGNVAMFTSVGTMATPRSANSGIVSSVSPVACSMQSMPASTRSRRESSAKQCAVTRAPSRCASAMAASTSARGQQALRSPASRSIQSPTSFTQPSPRRASRPT